MKSKILLVSFLLFGGMTIKSQDSSIAILWNETQLNCIRNYSPKPTVHARNLCHAAVLMYDCWAAYDDDADTYFLGNTWGGYSCPFNGITIPDNVQAAREEAISYAMYRFLWTRYTNFTASPAKLVIIQGLINAQMIALGYDSSITSTNYADGDPAKLGNYIAAKMEEFAIGDGSNQVNNYVSTYYQPVNGSLWPAFTGNPLMTDPNRWQPLDFVAQLNDNAIPPQSTVPALTPEWGNVVPFGLTDEQKTIHDGEGPLWNVYLDPGSPPLLDTTLQTGFEDDFDKWGFTTDIIWQSFHVIEDEQMMEISPSAIGNLDIINIDQLPTTFEEYKEFYNVWEGGNWGEGYDMNPVTNLPYQSQSVPRGDYTRAISEFWSYSNDITPAGHWFEILNSVMTTPGFEKRWEGEGPILDDLEYDVRAYLALGGGVHDAAIACWSAKGYYDYPRPISAIRFMAHLGQSTDEDLPHYHPGGLPLIPGFIELIEEGDPLVGDINEHLDEIKIFTFAGPVQMTGEEAVQWILAKNIVSYQPSTFVTPPYQSYYSGHATIARAAAEILTGITGNPYFPGGLYEVPLDEDDFIASEGPSIPLTLQWATYRDAADQCALSRIYSGVIPPQCDIPGRKAGLIIGPQAVDKTNEYLDAGIPHVVSIEWSDNLNTDADAETLGWLSITFSEEMNIEIDPIASFPFDNPLDSTIQIYDWYWTDVNQFSMFYTVVDANEFQTNCVMKVTWAEDLDGLKIVPAFAQPIVVDMQNPEMEWMSSDSILNDVDATSGSFSMVCHFNESMDVNQVPVISFTADDPSSTLAFNSTNSEWSDAQTFIAVFDAQDLGVELNNIDIQVEGMTDAAGNIQSIFYTENLFIIDTKNPSLISIVPSANMFSDDDVGESVLLIDVVYDEAMNTSSNPVLEIPGVNLYEAGIEINHDFSGWTDATNFHFAINITDMNVELYEIAVQVSASSDVAGNIQLQKMLADVFSIDTKNPTIISVVANDDQISDENVSTGFTLNIVYSEPVAALNPAITFGDEDLLLSTLNFNSGLSQWVSPQEYVAAYNVLDAGIELDDLGVEVSAGADINENLQSAFSQPNLFSVDTRNPELIMLLANTYTIAPADAGAIGFSLTASFDESMNNDNVNALVTFPVEDPTPVISLNQNSSSWLNDFSFEAAFDVTAPTENVFGVDIVFSGLSDEAGNTQLPSTLTDFFDISTDVSIDEVRQETIIVYPNPVEAGNDIVLLLPGIPQPLILQMCAASGQIVDLQYTINQAGNIISISTNSLAAGLYYINVYGTNGLSVLKVGVMP